MKKKNILSRKLRPNRPYALIIGGVMLAIVLLMTFFPSLFTSYDPLEQNFAIALSPPSAEHIFGTDNYGRDLFTRVVYGA